MRINDNKMGETCEVIGNVDETKEFEINNSSASVIIDSLINLYSNPVGSIVREIASNCVDAHRERDLKKLGKRELEHDDDLTYFSNTNVIDIMFETDEIIFKDHGVGLSKERVKNIFTVFGGSTKRDNNTEIGGFGLGSKSPFAYANTFFVRTCRNNKVYKYMLSRGASIPTMDLVFEKELEVLPGEINYNFTEIIIPYELKSDVSKFKKYADEQLKYFPQIRYTNHHTPLTHIIIDEKDYTVDTKSGYVGILIGNVEYPLNFNMVNPNFLGQALSRYNSLGLKLKFDIGELTLVPSREAIRYTEETKAKIVNKLTEVEKSISEKLSEVAKRSKGESDEQYLVKMFKLYVMIDFINSAYRYSYSNSDIDVKGYLIYLIRMFGFPSINVKLDIGGVNVELNGTLLGKIHTYLKAFNIDMVSTTDDTTELDFEKLDIKFFAKQSAYPKLSRQPSFDRVVENGKKITLVFDNKCTSVRICFLVSTIVNTLSLEDLAETLRNETTYHMTPSAAAIATEKVNTKKLKKEQIYHAVVNWSGCFFERSFTQEYVNFNNLLAERKKNPYIYICKKSDFKDVEHIFHKLPLPKTFKVYAVSTSNFDSIKETNPEVLFENWHAANIDKIRKSLEYLFELDLLDRLVRYNAKPDSKYMQINFTSMHLPGYTSMIALFKQSTVWPKITGKFQKSFDLIDNFTDVKQSIILQALDCLGLQDDSYAQENLGSSFELNRFIHSITNFISPTTNVEDIKKAVIEKYSYFKDYDNFILNVVKEDPIFYVLSENYNKTFYRYGIEAAVKSLTPDELKKQTIKFINERTNFYEKLLSV